MRKSFCRGLCRCNGPDFSQKCLDTLVAIVEKNGPAKRKLIEKAFLFAKRAHEGQFRADKKPYFLHPLETGAILAEMGLGSEAVAAGLLHDVLEDSEATPAKLGRLFGKEVCLLVEGVTKLDLLASETRNQNALKNLQNLLLATTRDPRVILIKLADKLHNLRTLEYLPDRDRRRIAGEALLIYVPIAHKVGLEDFASEFEDLAFMHAKPETFEAISEQLLRLRTIKENEIRKMASPLKRRLPKASFSVLEKSNYGIYTKMKNTGKTLSEINDYVVLNVLVGTREQCYLALGIIHSLFPPLPNKVKDFIAVPKPNGYSLLQTTVFGPRKKPVKVRISTAEMDAVNRRGVVAYRKIFKKGIPKQVQQSLSGLGFLLDNDDEDAFIYNLKNQFLARPAYVFNARGKLVEMPQNSTVLDFAFATEKNWALRLLRAKINGKPAEFGDRPDSGNVVELFFSKNRKARQSWLKDVTSPLAKGAIIACLKKAR